MERRGLEMLGRDPEADGAESEGEVRAVQMERLAFGERERGGQQAQRDAGMGTHRENSSVSQRPLKWSVLHVYPSPLHPLFRLHGTVLDFPLPDSLVREVGQDSPVAWSLVLRVRRLARRKRPPSFMLLIEAFVC